MLRHIHLGPAAMQTAIVLYLVGFILATEAIRRLAPKHGLDNNRMQNITMFGFVVGLLAARITYALAHWTAYHDDWQAWLSLTAQGLNTLGGVVGGLIAIGLGAWRYRLPARPVLDTYASGLGILLAVIPLAFLADGSVIGKPTDLPWAIDLWGQERHPTQLYAAIGAAVTLAVWWFYRPTISGTGFLIITIGNTLTWLVVGFLLAEPVLIFDQYRQVQVGAWLILMSSLLVWTIWQDQAQPT